MLVAISVSGLPLPPPAHLSFTISPLHYPALPFFGYTFKSHDVGADDESIEQGAEGEGVLGVVPDHGEDEEALTEGGKYDGHEEVVVLEDGVLPSHP